MFIVIVKIKWVYYKIIELIGYLKSTCAVKKYLKNTHVKNKYNVGPVDGAVYIAYNI